MSDLTDRMRTCAAAMAHDAGPDDAHWQWQRKYRDAVDLLLEASNVLEAIPEPLGEPMAIIPPVEVKPATPQDTAQPSIGQWYGPGDIMRPAAPRPNRVCPKCDSRAAKRVFRNGTELYLACPVCAAAWEYKP